MPVSVQVRIILRNDPGFNGRLRIIPYNGRKPQITHAPEARTHFLRVYYILPGVNVCLFTGKTEAALTVGQLLIQPFLIGDVPDDGINNRLVSGLSNHTHVIADTDSFFSATSRRNRPPCFTAFFFPKLNRGFHGININLPVGRIHSIQRIRSNNLFFRQVHANFLHAFLIDTKNLYTPILVAEDGRRTDKAVEDYGLQRIRIPEPLRLQPPDKRKCRHGRLETASLQKISHFLFGHWLCIQISLHIITADAFQEVRLLYGFHAFRKNLGFQPFRHLYG